MNCLCKRACKFCLFGIKGRKLVWGKPCTALYPKNLKLTIKHGRGGVMVGNLEFISSTMDHKTYLQILKTNLQESVKYWVLRKIICSNRKMTQSTLLIIQGFAYYIILKSS